MTKQITAEDIVEMKEFFDGTRFWHTHKVISRNGVDVRVGIGATADGKYFVLLDVPKTWASGPELRSVRKSDYVMSEKFRENFPTAAIAFDARVDFLILPADGKFGSIEHAVMAYNAL